jgi:endonuclease/exonuclease/phosphatase family metal-dependent hydrolase
MTTFSRRALALVVSTCVLLTALVASADASTKLGAATHIKMAATSSTATISWNKASGATAYRVCLMEAADQTPCAWLSGHSPATSAKFTGLTPNPGTDFFVIVYSYRKMERVAAKLTSFNLVPPPRPSAPASVKPAVTLTSATVTWAAATGATDYDVCLLTSGTATTCAQRSPRSTARSARFTGLIPSDGTDYYVRVYAHNAAGSTSSAMTSFDLPVAKITSMTATRVTGPTRVSTQWTPAHNADHYELQFATTSAMTTGLKNYTVAEPSSTVTLPLGVTYYYRARGTNGNAKGEWTAPSLFRVPSDPVTISVLTYNLCGQDKCVTSDNKMKKWSTRKPIAGRIARGANSTIIATQESHDKDTKFGTELPGYALGAYYSAKSLFYKTANYEKLDSGVITLDSPRRRYAVWVRLRDRSTKTVFYVADAHLEPYKGHDKDALREAQTKRLVSGMASVNPYNYPVIYAGDYNSNKSNTDQKKYPDGYDAPYKVFTAAGIPDIYDTAEVKDNAVWNSANQAKNPPTKHYDHIDHIFADSSITPLQFRVVLSLDGGDYATPFATDHNPVRGVLSVPGR